MDVHEEIGRLVAPLLHRTLFVCVSEPIAPPEEIVLVCRSLSRAVQARADRRLEPD